MTTAIADKKRTDGVEERRWRWKTRKGRRGE